MIFRIEFLIFVRWTNDGSPTLVLPITGTINDVTQMGPETEKCY